MDDIYETSIEEINFALSGSEIVVKCIIDKLISYTITNSYMNEIEKNIGFHCFKFLRSMLNEMVLMNTLSFDREDYKIHPKKLKEEEPVFFDHIFPGVNDWSEIPEPVSLFN